MRARALKRKPPCSTQHAAHQNMRFEAAKVLTLSSFAMSSLVASKVQGKSLRAMPYLFGQQCPPNKKHKNEPSILLAERLTRPVLKGFQQRSMHTGALGNRAAKKLNVELGRDGMGAKGKTGDPEPTAQPEPLPETV